MKRFKKLLVSLICAVAVFVPVTFGGCEMINQIESIVGGKECSCSESCKGDCVDVQSLMDVREKVRSFNIAIDTQYSETGFGGWFTRTVGVGLGSGVVFAETENTYYALTNNHVITQKLNGRTYKVRYTITDINGVEYEGKVEQTSETDDIAIISFTKDATSVLEMVNYTARLEDAPKAGEFVIAVGNPSGVKNIVTYGKIVGNARIGNVSYTVLSHNALINPGNSGGALCDMQGNLLGINTWGTEGKDDENFAIPLTKVKEYIDSFDKS